jgi:hypothetical protein
MSAPVARGEETPDGVKHVLMMVGFGNRWSVAANVSGFFHRSRHRACEDNLDAGTILAHPCPQQHTAAIRRIALREHEADILDRAEHLACFGRVDGFEHTIPALPQIFRQRAAHKNIGLNE